MSQGMPAFFFYGDVLQYVTTFPVLVGHAHSHTHWKSHSCQSCDDSYNVIVKLSQSNLGSC